MAHDQSDLLQGTLELIILKTLSEPMHGRERAQWERASAAVNWVLAWNGGSA